MLVGTATEGPQSSIVWPKPPLGAHTLSAIATAPNGATARSKSVPISLIGEPPPHGGVISINLVGPVNPLGADEVAGIPELDLARANWNNAISDDPNPLTKQAWS